MKRSSLLLLAFLPGLLSVSGVAAAAPDEAAAKLLQSRIKRVICSNTVYSIFEAAAIGDEDALKACLEEPDADVNKVDEFGNTATHLAAKGKSTRVMSMLLKAGADVAATNTDGKTPMDLCRNSKVRELLQKGEGARRKEIEVDAMVKEGDTKGVTRALKAGVNPNARAADGKGTLVLSAVSAGQMEILKLLLNAGADVNKASVGAPKPVLHTAAEKGDAQMISVLLKAGLNALPNAPDGSSALHHAIWGGHLEAFKALLPAYKSVNFSPQCGHHGFPINSTIYYRTENDNFSKAMVDAGINLNDEGLKSQYPLIFATQKGRTSLVKMFLEAGADKGVKDSEGKTAADYASGETADLLR